MVLYCFSASDRLQTQRYHTRDIVGGWVGQRDITGGICSSQGELDGQKVWTNSHTFYTTRVRLAGAQNGRVVNGCTVFGTEELWGSPRGMEK